MRSPRPSRCASRGSSHARSSGSGTCWLDGGAQLRRARSRRLVLADPRPACAPSPRAPSRRRPRRRRGSGRGATRPPRRGRRCTSRTPRRGATCRCRRSRSTETRCALRSSARRVEELLDEAQLAVAADERRLEARRRCSAPPRAAVTRSARQSAHRLGLALQLVLAGVLVGDRRLGRALRRLADEHRARLGGRLDARGGVDEVAGDHALPVGAERDRRLAGQHAGPSRERRVELGHRGDQVERRPHRALGVVLVRDGRPPHRHHRVADELLDRAAVALDQPLRRSRSSARAARASPRRRGSPTPS